MRKYISFNRNEQHIINLCVFLLFSTSLIFISFPLRKSMGVFPKKKKKTKRLLISFHILLPLSWRSLSFLLVIIQCHATFCYQTEQLTVIYLSVEKCFFISFFLSFVRAFCELDIRTCLNFDLRPWIKISFLVEFASTHTFCTFTPNSISFHENPLWNIN